MSYRIRSIAGALASVALVLAVAACSDASSPGALTAPEASFAKGSNGTEKFTFEDVTLVDGDLVVENAVVQAGVRDHKNDKNDWTNCSYFTEGWAESLGQYDEPVVPDDGSPEAVRDFCVESFPLR